jgi:hypothetical protein
LEYDMSTTPNRARLLAVLIALSAMICGCREQNRDTPQPPGGQQAPGVGMAGDERASRQIMIRLGKGPNALDGTVKRELQGDEPDWASIQPHAAEYAQMAADLGKAEPAKGSKESWVKETTAFAESAAALDKSAQDKDLNAARVAHEKLSRSCMQCHREHRGPPGGPGKFGPPGKRGGPPPT